MLGSIGLCNFNNTELVYVRRAYINELGIPPSISEIEWLMEFKSKNVRETGIDYVLDYKYGKESFEYKTKLRNFYLTDLSKNELTVSQQHIIVKYQAGDLNLTIEQAKNKLVACALMAAENQEDPIDYLFLCLCGRYTNTPESNFYNKAFKHKDGTDKENTYLILQLILNSNNFLLY